MTIREQMENQERALLSPYAMYSADTRGRAGAQEECDIRPAFQRDRDRILHCKSFRRLKHKTQVFLAPQGDHYRTRLTHTLEVSQIARTIARALRLNESLVEAIALGHDIGHTPFGHAGERVLDQLCEGGFRHNEQSVRIAEKLEKDGEGLNLTAEVLDGILNHQMAGNPMTLEGHVVRLSDKIAYIHHDIDDALRAQLMRESDVPEEIRHVLGETTKERLDCMIHDIIFCSMDQNEIVMSQEKYQAMQDLRQFMFENLYTNPVAKGEEAKTIWVLESLFDYYRDKPELLPDYLRAMIDAGEPTDRIVCDYVAGMTDQFAIAKFKDFFIPKEWRRV